MTFIVQRLDNKQNDSISAIRYFLLCIIALPLISFKDMESCENIQPGSITIYPVCGDRSSYIQRRFEADSFVSEDVYEKGLHTCSTKIWLSGRQVPDSVRFTEFVYQSKELINTRSSSELNLASRQKVFRGEGSRRFEINYHENGFIQSYGFRDGFCWLSGIDSDPKNKFFWKGRFQSPLIDTLAKTNNKIAAAQPSSVSVRCGDRTGVWKKLNVRGMVVDSVDMTGTAGESASWRRWQQTKGATDQSR